MKVLNLSTFSSDEGREVFKSHVEPLVERTYSDPVFKAEFIANPGAVIERETGLKIDFPERWHFTVIDRSDPFALYLDIPVNKDLIEDELELTDEELELVAGGGENNGLFCSDNENCKGANCVAGCGSPAEEE